MSALSPVRTRFAEIIVNASSGVGAGRELRSVLLESFRSHDIEANISLARDGNELTALARQAASSKADIVVAGGGDGTINAVATAIIDHGKTLGVLPLGTLNHFSKDLAIPPDLPKAVQTILDGHTIEVDVGEMNGRIFLNNSSLGLYPSIVRARDKTQRQQGFSKWPAFAWAALTMLRRYPFLDVRLQVEGKEFFRRTPFVFIGNNRYLTDMFRLGTRASLNDGELSLYISNRMGRLGLLRLAVRALIGRMREDKEFLELSTNELRITTRRKRLLVAFDGEVEVAETPFHYRVRPRALRVIVPAPESKID